MSTLEKSSIVLNVLLFSFWMITLYDSNTWSGMYYDLLKDYYKLKDLNNE